MQTLFEVFEGGAETFDLFFGHRLHLGVVGREQLLRAVEFAFDLLVLGEQLDHLFEAGAFLAEGAKLVDVLSDLGIAHLRCELVKPKLHVFELADEFAHAMDPVRASRAVP